LVGPPGTGKSYLAQCISTEAEVPFAYASAASFRGMFWGMDVLMVKNLYRKARRYAREYGACVVFIDEFDAIGTSRSGSGSQMSGMAGGGFFGGTQGGLNELLMQMDPPPIEGGWLRKLLRIIGLIHSRVQLQPVLTIGATNLPQSLDAAILRPGRFDRKILIDPPSDKYRPEVVEYYLKKVKYDPKISIKAVSQRLIDATPVVIKHIINEAVIIAHFDGREMITYKDIIEAQNVHEFGLRQESELTEIERRRLAYHEAGHTVACYYLYEREFPAFVTVQKRIGVEGALAFAAPRPKETVLTRNKKELLAQMQVFLASRAAEELFLDTQLNGVYGDFKEATEMAAIYIGACGMDGTISSAFAFKDQPGLNIHIDNNLSERVEKLLQSQFQAVKALLQEHSDALIAVAEALIERNELLAEEIKELIDEADARQVTKRVIDEFEPLLGTTANGNGRNGHPRVNGKSNGTGSLPTPRPTPAPLNSEEGPTLPRAESSGHLPTSEDDPYHF
jgi:cell division protease FtsH